MGGWQFIDVLGKPLIELDEPLVDDLMTLRWLAGIAETIKSKSKSTRGQNTYDHQGEATDKHD
jgi:hypothetical protein